MVGTMPTPIKIPMKILFFVTLNAIPDSIAIIAQIKNVISKALLLDLIVINFSRSSSFCSSSFVHLLFKLLYTSVTPNKIQNVSIIIDLTILKVSRLLKRVIINGILIAANNKNVIPLKNFFLLYILIFIFQILL